MSQLDVSATSYLEHAREINRIACGIFDSGPNGTQALSAKISIGLSLHACELAGKAILRSLGQSVADIRSNHRTHDLPTLLRDAEVRLQARPEPVFAPYRHFVLRTPSVGGVTTSTTIAAYFEDHFAKGASATLRSYLYPDEDTFTGPVPIQAVAAIAEDLIHVAEQVELLTSALPKCGV